MLTARHAGDCADTRSERQALGYVKHGDVPQDRP
jgi:hypothetical protein